MSLESDNPDSLTALWARAEAKADAAAKETPTPAPAAEPASEPETEAAAETQEPAASKPDAKAKTKEPEPDAAPADEDRKQFDALAKKLGYAVDGNRVAVQERVKFRQEKATWRQQQEQRDAEFRSRVEQTKSELDKQYGRGAKAIEAWERGDFDGVAQALADDGKADWKGIQKLGAQRIMSPEAKRVRELEERERAREEAAQRAKQEQEQAAAQQEQQKAVTAYKDRLRGQMGSSEDRVVKALSKLPHFVDAVYEVQSEHWDRESDDTVPKPEEALSLSYGGRPLIDTARELWQVLSEAFGDPGASTQEAPNGVGNRSAAVSARPGSKPKTLSRNGAAEVSATGKPKSEKEFMDTWTRRLAEADG